MTTLICDCNQTMPLDPRALSASLNEPLTCTQPVPPPAGVFLQAAGKGDELVVPAPRKPACSTSWPTRLKPSTPIKFVNIRETGGWSRDAAQPAPKLPPCWRWPIARARAVATVTYKSAGRALIIGELGAAERAAELLGDTLNVTFFTQGAGAWGRRRSGVTRCWWPDQSLAGWLGAFELNWQQNNPIDLDLCTRCNACLAACPEDAIGLDYQVDLTACDANRACVKVCKVGVPSTSTVRRKAKPTV